jgi:hypothetical protein
MMMKKWKWASIEPLENTTSAAEQYTSPAEVSNDATRRCDFQIPSSMQPISGASPTRVASRPCPSHRANMNNAGRCRPSTHNTM